MLLAPSAKADSVCSTFASGATVPGFQMPPLCGCNEFIPWAERLGLVRLLGLRRGVTGFAKYSVSGVMRELQREKGPCQSLKFIILRGIRVEKGMAGDEAAQLRGVVRKRCG